MTSRKSDLGVKSKRGATLHVYIKKENKEWAEKQAHKDGLSVSHYIDILLTKLRIKKSSADS